MELAAIACAIAFTALVVALRQCTGSSHQLSPRRAMHFLMAASMWQLPPLVGVGELVSAEDLDVRPEAGEEVWHECQLALATVDATSLILDCLVPTTHSDVLEGAGLSVPITLRTSGTAVDGGRAIDVLSSWAQSERCVDITLEARDGSAVVEISRDGRIVTMLLEARMVG